MPRGILGDDDSSVHFPLISATGCISYSLQWFLSADFSFPFKETFKDHKTLSRLIVKDQ